MSEKPFDNEEEEEEEESRLWLIRGEGLAAGMVFCFDDSCMDQIMDEGVFPNTTYFVDKDTKIEVSGSPDKCRDIAKAVLGKKVTTCGSEQVGNKVATNITVSGAIEANNPTYCEPGVRCVVKGLLMCVGVFVMTEHDGLIAFHYVSGDDEREKYKLTDTLKLMDEHSFKDATLQLYIWSDLTDLRYQKERDKSMEKIREDLMPPGSHHIKYQEIHQIKDREIERTAPV